MTQLRDLAKPFAPRLIKQPPKGKFGTYVAHDVVNQKLLAVLGAFDFEVIELVRGSATPEFPMGRIEGCLSRLTCEIDGRRTTVVEVGDCENPSNWTTEGGRMKDAASDSFKRCAMRLGVGIHLWAGQDFFLFDVLDKEEPRLPLELDPGRPFVDVETGAML